MRENTHTHTSNRTAKQKGREKNRKRRNVGRSSYLVAGSAGVGPDAVADGAGNASDGPLRHLSTHTKKQTNGLAYLKKKNHPVNSSAFKLIHSVSRTVA